MADDKPTMRITTPTDLAGAVPHMVGYQPDNNQIAILGFHGPNYIGAAVHTWAAELGDGPAHTAEVTNHITRAFADRANSYLAIGYGPEGPDRALLFQDAFQQTETQAQAWAVDNDRLRVFTPGRGWSPEADLEDTAGTEYSMVTGAQPAATREDLAQHYEPVSEDQQAHLDPETAQRFATMAPTAQYEWAARALTEGAESKTGLSDEHVAVIAHAVATSVHIRDNLLADVIGDSIKADRLVDVFRRCDDARRPDMADLAGAGQYITRGSTVSIEAITRHTTGSLGRMANHAASLGLDPQPLIDSIDRDELRQRLISADRQHYRNHVAGRPPLLPSPDPRATTRPAPQTGQQTKPHPWAGMDR